MSNFNHFQFTIFLPNSGISDKGPEHMLVIYCWLKYPLLDFPLTFHVKPQFSRKYYDIETQDLLKSPVGHWGRSVNQLCLPHIVTFTPSIRVI